MAAMTPETREVANDVPVWVMYSLSLLRHHPGVRDGVFEDLDQLPLVQFTPSAGRVLRPCFPRIFEYFIPLTDDSDDGQCLDTVDKEYGAFLEERAMGVTKTLALKTTAGERARKWELKLGLCARYWTIKFNSSVMGTVALYDTPEWDATPRGPVLVARDAIHPQDTENFSFCFVPNLQRTGSDYIWMIVDPAIHLALGQKGREVIVKAVGRDSSEKHIIGRLTTSPLRDHPENHTIPVMSILDLGRTTFLVQARWGSESWLLGGNGVAPAPGRFSIHA
ncbi:hypothetical protein K438DRAFT_1977089 [Mycena galopus ATCC 62051]|nr:hypothetical protein K438DRAFT_1977089 [Mycena galopus ATCC 62051]